LHHPSAVDVPFTNLSFSKLIFRGAVTSNKIIQSYTALFHTNSFNTVIRSTVLQDSINNPSIYVTRQYWSFINNDNSIIYKFEEDFCKRKHLVFAQRFSGTITYELIICTKFSLRKQSSQLWRTRWGFV